MKGLPKKSEDISAWYNSVIDKAQLADHGPSKGTIIIRPNGYALWEAVQRYMDPKIKELGAQNGYFPLFIPMSFLSKEKEHVKGFSPELAVVTHGGGEKLAEPLVVRPTSETIMYDSFSKWIQSFRDLPMCINQWNNVVRWEKRPYLFLRTTEFLWQEGHCAHQTAEENQKMIEDALDMYKDTYQNLMGLFGYPGRKSESEKFAGADATLTYEILMPDGKVIQGCTSHNLGQNFSKAFNVKFQDQTGNEQYVHQNSWGFTTRSIGALILAHGDNNGLILPPNIAPTQVVIIPIKGNGSNYEEILKLAEDTFNLLKSNGVRVKMDDSDQSVGWKFNQYDLLGVPIRIEIGSLEAQGQKVSIMTRDESPNGESSLDNLVKEIEDRLLLIQQNLFNKSKQFTLDNTRDVSSYDQLKDIMKTTRGFIKAFWCEDEDCETKIKEETKASTRCLPFDAAEEDGKCVYCGKDAKHRWLFAQSY